MHSQRPTELDSPKMCPLKPCIKCNASWSIMIETPCPDCPKVIHLEWKFLERFAEAGGK